MSRPWTDEEERAASACWFWGESASQIAKTLGRSRNSVIGRKHRKGWKRHYEVMQPTPPRKICNVYSTQLEKGLIP